MERSTSWSKDALQAMETHLRLLHSSAEATTESPLASATISSPVSLQAVDLNSQEPLPHGWEQFLHLQVCLTTAALNVLCCAVCDRLPTAH